MNWPGSGDPYYTAEGGVRRTYYGVNSVPMLFLDGGSASTSQSAFVSQFNNAYAVTEEATITGTFQVVGTTITVEGSVTPSISGSGHVIHVAVCEKMTTGNVGSNGETKFYHVMMKMLPNANGTSVTLTSGTAIPFNFTHDMSSTNVEEMQDLEVVVFVQNTSSKDVLNAAYLEDISTPAPNNVTATHESGTLNVAVTWEAPTGVTPTGYNVYRDGVKLNPSPLSSTTFSYSDVAPEYGITYKYGVAAIVDGYEGYYGYDEVMTMVDVPEPEKVEVEQVQIGEKLMRITWEVPNVDFSISGYNIFRNNNIKVNTTLVTDLFFENTGLSFREYCFKVEAVVNELVSEKSEEGCVTLIESAAAPANLQAAQTAINELTINLTWDAASGAEGYHIYRDGEKINDEAVTATAYQDEVAEFNVEYCYTAKGVFAGTPGPESNKACATAYDRIIPAVTGTSAEQNGENIKEIKIVWDAVTEGTVDGYNIYRAGEKINSALLSETSYVDNTIEFDVEYCYTVAVVIEGIEGPKSDEACATALYIDAIASYDLETAINIYPNPVTDKLYLDTELNVTEYQIFDLQGRLIYASKTGEKEIPAKEWASGVYIMKITTDKGIVNKRFVKQ